MAIQFTARERFQKNHTVAEAIDAATLVLKYKHHLHELNVSSVVTRDNAEKISLVELNRITAAIVADTVGAVA